MFALILSNLQIAVVVLSVIAVVALIGWLFRKDDKIEARRKRVLDAGKVLAEEGFEMCAEACNQYGVGDYSGFYGTMRELVRQLLNPETRLTLLRKPFRKQLVNALQNEEEKAWVLKTIAEHEAAEASKAGKALAAKKK